MKKALVLIFLVMLSACSSTKPVNTVAPDRTIGHWQVVTTAGTPNDHGLCYAFSAPVSTDYPGKRAASYIMATRRASGKVEISVSSGYVYVRGSDVKLATDSITFKLKPKESIAWAQNDMHDKSIVAAIRKAASLEVRATAADGKTSTDVYSADGFSEALTRVKALCP